MSEGDEWEELASEKELREKECEMNEGVWRGGMEVDVYGRILRRQRVVSGKADLKVFECLSQAVPFRVLVPWWQSVTSGLVSSDSVAWVNGSTHFLPPPHAHRMTLP